MSENFLLMALPIWKSYQNMAKVSTKLFKIRRKFGHWSGNYRILCRKSSKISNWIRILQYSMHFCYNLGKVMNPTTMFSVFRRKTNKFQLVLLKFYDFFKKITIEKWLIHQFWLNMYFCPSHCIYNLSIDPWKIIHFSTIVIS